MRLNAIITLLVVMLVVAGCSGDSISTIDVPGITHETGIRDEPASERMLWGVWDIHFDTENLTIDVVPLRDMQKHWDVTSMITPPACDDCMTLEVNSFDPVTRILEADVTLRNPFQINGYDVRGILYTNEYGHRLVNAEDWTALFDIPGGESLNPFRSFAKPAPKRLFNGGAEHTENYLVYIPQPPNYGHITYAVTASWPGNCREPYCIEGFEQYQTLYDYESATAKSLVFVRDWQGDVDKVTLVAPEITGEPFTQFYYDGADMWRLTIENATAASAGDYTGRIIASSEGSGELALYDYVIITVTETNIPVVTVIDPDNAEAGTQLDDVTITGSNFMGPGEVWLFRLAANSIIGENVVFENSNTVTCDFDIPFDQMTGKYNVVVKNVDEKEGAGIELFEVLCPVPVVDSISVESAYAGANLTGVIVSGNKFRGPGAGVKLKKTGESDIDASNVVVNEITTVTCDISIPPDAATGVYDIEVINDCDASGTGAGFFEVTTKDGWAITWGGSETDGAYSVALDSDDYIYTGGVVLDDRAYIRKFNPDGSLVWERIWQGDESFDQVSVADLMVNEWDYIYATGTFQGTIDFDPNPVDVVEFTAVGNTDAYIISFFPDGDLRFAYVWGGSGSDGARGIGGYQNNIYVTGYFRDTVDFKPGPFTEEHKAVAEHDVYVSKFDGYGDHQWTATWGGSCGSYYQDVGSDVLATSDGDVFVIGHFQGTADFDPTTGVHNLTSWGSSDAFINWLNSDGSFVDAGIWGGLGYDGCGDIARSSSGDIYLTGFFEGFADMNPTGGLNNRSSNGDYDAFIVKLLTTETSLVYDDAVTWGGLYSDVGYGVAAHDGGVYVTGKFESTVDFDPGAGEDEHSSNEAEDVFLSSFDTSFAFLWARTWGGEGNDIGLGLDTDDPGNAFISGIFTTVVDFDPGIGEDWHASNDAEDAFLAKYPPSGDW